MKLQRLSRNTQVQNQETRHKGTTTYSTLSCLLSPAVLKPIIEFERLNIELCTLSLSKR